ncbi:LOW QUALITY PROTEIN: hypothetical protein PHMEG_00027871 [Phytophthora megakarya]|uniref:Uncharacterized protein n=1 Tax=Phytophthora megakarya TaxID=4795 RepID=A0A225V8U9_9STRA|nr:LOW QUALITY PROTEIN: hypothetical protein PHMEG_00027871 [Phytophthora megakarya]
MVQWIRTHFSDCLVENEVVEAAARRGHLWLLENSNSHEGIEWGTKCIKKTAKSGHWNVVHWLHQPIGTHISELRFRGEVADSFYQCNTEELKWVIANGFKLSDYLSVDKWDLSKREKCWEVVRYVMNEGLSNGAILFNRPLPKLESSLSSGW